MYAKGSTYMSVREHPDALVGEFPLMKRMWIMGCAVVEKINGVRLTSRMPAKGDFSAIRSLAVFNYTWPDVPIGGDVLRGFPLAATRQTRFYRQLSSSWAASACSSGTTGERRHRKMELETSPAPPDKCSQFTRLLFPRLSAVIP